MVRRAEPAQIVWPLRRRSRAMVEVCWRIAGQRWAPWRTAERRAAQLYYVTPDQNWSNDWDGRYITLEIARQFGWPTHVTSTARGLTGQIVHYGSLWSFLGSLGHRQNSRNVIVVTVFHGDRTAKFPELAQAMDRLLAHAHVPSRIVTACRLMEERLIRWGIPPQRLVRIPLGVELARFRPASPEERAQSRRALEIPEGAFCIGSFQKDGAGWGQGLTPKLIKGPDILLGVLERLRAHGKVTAILSGPARGYVIRGLRALGIAYRHLACRNYRELAHLYHGLDAYLVTSREEGGPKGILEAFACGIPLISTRVGMAPDLVEHERNGLLANSEDADGLARLTLRLMGDPSLGQRLAASAWSAAEAYDWSRIAARYYHEVYQPLCRP